MKNIISLLLIFVIMALIFLPARQSTVEIFVWSIVLIGFLHIISVALVRTVFPNVNINVHVGEKQ